MGDILPVPVVDLVVAVDDAGQVAVEHRRAGPGTIGSVTV
jgi:hypothetical protein